MAQVKVTETVLRDAHQSLIATRMTMDEMRPILSTMDKVGFHSVECWGGATFDSCLRFLNEDPWERLRIIKKEMPNTKLQMLFRGQNMLGYRHYADDVLEYFVQKSVANGIDIIRIFDALNDIRNLETAVKAAKKEGRKAKVEEKKVEPAPAPKKKKVVRVNREVMSLDRTMTVSVVDALRVAMTRCWVVDTSRADIEGIRAVAHLTMRRNGTVRDVWFESEARAETDAGFAYVLQTIRDAINVCQPLKMLPANEFNKWEKIQLTFYPTTGKVM